MAKQESVRVFVSHHHSREEDRFTARLVADLAAAGADVWVDDDNVIANDFVQKISEGLDGRQWLVLVMTPQSVASRWVQKEVNTALNEHTAGRMLGVIPIIMTTTRDEEIPMLWRPLHRYDATQSYESARDKLLRALGLMASGASTPQSDLPPSTMQPASSPLVFIVHSNRDDLFANRLVDVIKRAGGRVWIDHERFAPGTHDWAKQIRQGIKQATSVLYIGSESAAVSPYVLDDVTLARDEGKRIIPIWGSGERWSECVPLGMAYMQYIDGRGPNFERGMSVLLTALGLPVK